MSDTLRRLFRWWEIRRLGIKPPVEYCEIQSTRPPEFETKGWVPRQVFEDVTGREFRPGQHNFIRRDHSEKLQKHPLFVLDLEEQNQ